MSELNQRAHFDIADRPMPLAIAGKVPLDRLIVISHPRPLLLHPCCCCALRLQDQNSRRRPVRSRLFTMKSAVASKLLAHGAPAIPSNSFAWIDGL